MAREKTDYLYFAYNNSENIDDFSAYIDNYLANKTPQPLKGFFLVSSVDLFAFLNDYKSEEYKLNFLKTTTNFLSFDLVRKMDRKEGNVSIKGRAILFKTNKPNVYVTFTNSNRRFLEYGLRRFFDRFYPNVASVYLSSINLREILRKIQQQKTESELMARKVVAYARIEDEFEIKGKQMYRLEEKKMRESEVKYTEEPFEKSFKRAFENNAWVDKINYVYFVLDEKKKGYTSFHEAFLSRDGIFKVYSNFGFFIKTVINEIGDISQKLYVLFNNRNRLKEARVDASKPLKIVYDSDIFLDVGENKKLILAMETLKNASISVFHGNPYVHMSLVDYLDGSSYDLWVLSINEIIITPQLRASFASLNRVLNHIFEKFREGRIEDVGEIKNG